MPCCYFRVPKWAQLWWAGSVGKDLQMQWIVSPSQVQVQCSRRSATFMALMGKNVHEQTHPKPHRHVWWMSSAFLLTHIKNQIWMQPSISVNHKILSWILSIELDVNQAVNKSNNAAATLLNDCSHHIGQELTDHAKQPATGQLCQIPPAAPVCSSFSHYKIDSMLRHSGLKGNERSWSDWPWLKQLWHTFYLSIPSIPLCQAVRCSPRT